MKKLNQDSFFNTKNTGIFFKRFNDSWENVYSFGKNSNSQWLGGFKSETIFEKKIVKIVHIFLSSEIWFSSSLRIVFSPFDAFFVKRGTTFCQKFLLLVIFFVLRLSKYYFLVFRNSFSQKVCTKVFFSDTCMFIEDVKDWPLKQT